MGTHFNEDSKNINKWLIIGGIISVSVLIILIIILGVSSNSNLESISNDTEYEVSKQMENNTNINDAKITSSSIGKSVDELETSDDEFTVAVIEDTNTDSSSTEKEENESETITQSLSSTENEVQFVAPVKGEVIKEFAPDSLVYSKTLDEWIVHNGIDIKDDKTSVVSAVANGTVKSIKNDPRYGLTVIIEHDDGYQSLYANLLTAEFVVEGETVEEGQTIGTIGNSAAFEIEDDFHLHFELSKDGEYINPLSYFSL